MATRVAFFASKEEVETFFGVTAKSDQLFEPHYNLAMGQHILVARNGSNGPEMVRVRWGSPAGDATISIDDAEKHTGKNIVRCAAPLSGFYVWKDNREKDHPFFVRMLNGPLMVTAGLIFNDDEPHMKMILGKSNVLVQPMSETMPVIMDRNTALEWIQGEGNASEVLSKSAERVLLTDLSVMRVSKKVNDPKNNNPKLIQPIPK
jgi:putative SOS response-associated peptidase YedK